MTVTSCAGKTEHDVTLISYSCTTLFSHLPLLGITNMAADSFNFCGFHTTGCHYSIHSLYRDQLSSSSFHNVNIWSEKILRGRGISNVVNVGGGFRANNFGKDCNNSNNNANTYSNIVRQLEISLSCISFSHLPLLGPIICGLHITCRLQVFTMLLALLFGPETYCMGRSRGGYI